MDSKKIIYYLVHFIQVPRYIFNEEKTKFNVNGKQVSDIIVPKIYLDEIYYF